MRNLIRRLLLALALTSCAPIGTDSASDSKRALRAADTALQKAVTDTNL